MYLTCFARRSAESRKAGARSFHASSHAETTRAAGVIVTRVLSCPIAGRASRRGDTVTDRVPFAITSILTRIRVTRG